MDALLQSPLIDALVLCAGFVVGFALRRMLFFAMQQLSNSTNAACARVTPIDVPTLHLQHAQPDLRRGAVLEINVPSGVKRRTATN